mmetsp:Transcript_28794/g.48570  ORF Transcript_28794/g.48570 Transcript_28794/m.48570 type:complete len:105 (+) Transcript_28794:216-530(+)
MSEKEFCEMYGVQNVEISSGEDAPQKLPVQRKTITHTDSTAKEVAKWQDMYSYDSTDNFDVSLPVGTLKHKRKRRNSAPSVLLATIGRSCSNDSVHNPLLEPNN